MFPNPSGLFSQPHGFSLPTQRCFLIVYTGILADHLFSAYAEVFPFYSQSKRAPPPFLCLRRGVSAKSSETASAASFSLPTQRCFFCGLDCIPPGLLFSAYAEVFPDDYDHHLEGGAFLCLRRGVSEKEARLYRYRNFSLPTQRCFQRIGVEVRVICLFSAYAEVFPTHTDQRHADRSFSLPTQRCFH